MLKFNNKAKILPNTSRDSSSTRELLMGFCWLHRNSGLQHIEHFNLVSFFQFELVILVMGKLGTATTVSSQNNFYASLHINYLANLSSLLTLG